jgi:outer membrane protein OmpA-like peptidoglycan-associated protein
MLQTMRASLALTLALAVSGCALFQTTEDKLARDLEKLGLLARKTPRGLVLYLPDVLFEFDSQALTSAAEGKVAAVAEVILRLAPERALSVEGHTDSIGEVAYNFDLSLRRAEGVSAQLIEAGIPAEQISTMGYGERFPIVENRTPEGQDDPVARAQNRRVEVVILR